MIVCATTMKVSSQAEMAEPSLTRKYTDHSCSLFGTTSALEKFYEVKQIRESLFGVESCPVIQTMLRIGNIQLCKGEVKKALDCFSEVSDMPFQIVPFIDRPPSPH